MSRAVFFSFFLLFFLFDSAFALSTSLTPKAVEVTEVSEYSDSSYVELYSPNGINAQNWQIVLNDPGSGTVVQCSFSHDFAAGGFLVITEANCPGIGFHPNKNEVFVLDGVGAVVHYVSLWQDGTGQSNQSYEDYFDHADPLVTTNLNSIVDGRVNYCAIIDPSTGEQLWQEGCTQTPGTPNSEVDPDIELSYFTVSKSEGVVPSDELEFKICIKNTSTVFDTQMGFEVSVPALLDWEIVSAPANYGDGVWSVAYPFGAGESAELVLRAKMKICTPTKSLTATANYPYDKNPLNNQKTVEISAECPVPRAVEQGAGKSGTMFSKISNVSFDADIICDSPANIQKLEIFADGIVAVDVNGSVASVEVLSDRLRLRGLSVPRAAKIAKFRINGSVLIDDAFSVLPSGFDINASSFRAEPSELLFRALNGGGGYDGTVGVSAKLSDSSKEGCTASGFFEPEVDTLVFTNDTNISTLFPKEIGDINLTLSDTDWSGYSGDRAAGDCEIGAPTAQKPSCDINTTIQISVVPYKIVLSNVTAIEQNDMVPMANIADDNSSDVNKSISATVKAQNFDGASLKNFSKECFAKSVDIRYAFELGRDTNASYALSSDENAVSPAKLTATRLESPLLFELGGTNFEAGEAPMRVSIAIPRGECTGCKEPLGLVHKELNATLEGTLPGGHSFGDKNTTFVYSRASIPNAGVEFAPVITLRAYLQLYSSNISNLPLDGSTLTNYPSSSRWWINRFNSLSAAIKNIIIKESTKLDTLSGKSGFSFGSEPPYSLLGGVAPLQLYLDESQNRDQKVYIHLDVPTYLWYGSRAYSFAEGSDCSQHPCAVLDIFGTGSGDAVWFGSGDNKGDKTIKTVPKGKRVPKINW